MSQHAATRKRYIDRQVSSRDNREIVEMVLTRPGQPHIQTMAEDVWFVDLPADVFKTVVADSPTSHVVLTYRNSADRRADWEDWRA